MGKFESSGPGEPLSEINTTPLVDVMLVLLVIFIITAPLMTRGIALDLPKSDTPTVITPPQTITISINAKGELFLDKKPVNADALRAGLTAAAAKSKSTPVHLRAERDTRYESVVEVMAMANALGLSQLAFVTDLPKK
ncbi:MAG: ExbD/TolR family protein [Burkholderiaceae bacterium]